LRRFEDEKKIGLAQRNHRAVNLCAKAHVAGDGPAALAHSFDGALFDIETAAHGDIGNNIGSGQNALSA
jgi:hypothetical protein